jgi:DNA invertase Pin-like site-specific DNA recombinase
MTKAVIYLRTSSATNVGGDSDVRQRQACEAYAAGHGIEIVGEFYDAAVSGTDPVQTRPAFNSMLDKIEGNGVRLVIIEDASRFARDLMTQECGLGMLAARGVRVIAANTGDDMTDTSDPMKKMLRQIVGAIVEAEKSRLVAKLKGARDRRSAVLGYHCGSRYQAPGGVADEARELRASGMSMQAIADELARRGRTTKAGKPLHFTQVARLLKAG